MTTQVLIASTITIAPPIVTIQSIAIRQEPRAAPAVSRSSGFSQWSEMRFGGQYVANTLPIRFLRGTEPQRRESHDSPRLSPMKK